MPLPHRERSTKPRKKAFTTHLLSEDCNQKVIYQSDTKAKAKEKKKTDKDKKVKDFLAAEKANEKKKKAALKAAQKKTAPKVVCRKDKVKAKAIPSRPRLSGGGKK